MIKNVFQVYFYIVGVIVSKQFLKFLWLFGLYFECKSKYLFAEVLISEYLLSQKDSIQVLLGTEQGWHLCSNHFVYFTRL